jgi:Origin of replication binding protein
MKLQPSPTICWTAWRGIVALSVLQRKLKLSIQPEIIDRNVPEKRMFVWGWVNVELSPEELAAAIKEGHPYCGQTTGYRDRYNFEASDIVSLDIDCGLTIEEALQNPFVAAHGTLLYTTLSHRPDAHRFRLIFSLPRTVTDPNELSAVMRALQLRIAGDRKVVDPARLFYGNRNAEVLVFDRELSGALLEDLIAQGLNPPEPDTVLSAGRGQGSAPSRSCLNIAPDQQIRLAKGGTACFRDLMPRTPIHCPFHHDQDPSAFVVANRHGIAGIHCSACGCSYWPKTARILEEDLFGDFEQVVRRAATNQSDPRLNASTVQIVNGSALPPQLLPGIMMVRSPKGTGKTFRLNPLIARSRSVLLIGHRRSLIRQSCNRLDLHCYLDDEGIPNLNRHPRYGICLDSLAKIPPTGKFDIVILDESEQVLAHFLSETMDRGGGSRDRIFVEFGRLVRQAKTVVALDADLGWVTFRTLSRVGQGRRKNNTKAVHIWLNEAKPKEGRAIHVYESETHLVAELTQAVSDGKRCFVTSNAKGKIEKLAAVIIDKFSDKKTITITSDTITNTAVQDFITDPKSTARLYDVIFASPSIGTGIDIAFPKNDQLIDVVFGFCEAQITNHLDFDQQLARVGHPKEVRVWITPRRFHFETEFEVIKRDVLERSLFKNLLVGYSDSGQPEYNENDPFLEMAALILSEQRASKNALKAHFIRHKEKEGFVVEQVQSDEDLTAEGKGIVARGKQLSREQYCKVLLSASPLTRSGFNRTSEALRRGERVSEQERASYERTNLELFYREETSEELIELDDRRRFRRKVTLYETAFANPCLTNGIDDRNRFDGRLNIIVTEKNRADAVSHLIGLTPLLKDGRFCPETIIDQSDLGKLVETMVSAKTSVENVLGIEVRSDVHMKPVQQLGALLGLVGLKLERVQTQKDQGRKIYRYRLEPDSLGRMKGIVERRKVLSQSQFGYKQYGWSETEDNEDVS